MADADHPKKRAFRTFFYRGVELEKLLDLSEADLIDLLPSRKRRKFQRAAQGTKPYAAKNFIKKLRDAKKTVTEAGQKPDPVNTHLRNLTIVPEMIGSVVGVYNGQTFVNVEIKPEMIGYYLGEFSITYKPVKHGKPGIGATHSSRFIPLK